METLTNDQETYKHREYNNNLDPDIILWETWCTKASGREYSALGGFGGFSYLYI